MPCCYFILLQPGNIRATNKQSIQKRTIRQPGQPGSVCKSGEELFVTPRVFIHRNGASGRNQWRLERAVSIVIGRLALMSLQFNRHNHLPSSFNHFSPFAPDTVFLTAIVLCGAPQTHPSFAPAGGLAQSPGCCRDSFPGTTLASHRLLRMDAEPNTGLIMFMDSAVQPRMCVRGISR